MRLFDKRPLALACSLAIILSFVFAYAGIYAVFTAALCAVICAGASIFIKIKAKRTILTVCASALIMCAAFFAYCFDSVSVPKGSVVRVSGYVLSDGDDSYTRIYKITNIDGKPVGFNAASYSGETKCAEFSGFEADAEFTEYSGYNENYYKSKGVLFSVKFTNFSLAGKTHRGISYYAGKIRSFFSGCFYRVCDNAGILCRIFLGIREGTPQSFVSDMKALGVSHLLAVSGLHVTALLAGADFVLRRMTGKSRTTYIILSCAAAVYMAVTGFTGSVVRASVMYILSRLSFIVSRKNDPVTSLMFSAYIIITVNPPSVFDVGFLLSFSAALGIITAGAPATKFTERKLKGKLKILQKIISPVIITLSALLFTIPVAAVSYGKLAYGAIVYNLLTAPFAACLLYICPYIILFSHVPFAGRVFGLAADGICNVFEKIVHFLAKYPAPSVSVSYPFVVPLIAVFLVFTVVLAVFSKKRVHYLCLALAFVLTFSSFAAIFSLTEAQKTYIMVSGGKNGDYAAVIDRGKCTVFDFTEGSADGFYQLCQKLLSKGVTRADYVLAAPPESRHLQSVILVCSYFDIENIYAPSYISDELSGFCGKTVLAADGTIQEYNSAKLTIFNGARCLGVKNAVYCAGMTNESVGYASRFQTVITDEPYNEYRSALNGDVYCAGMNKEVLVISTYD